MLSRRRLLRLFASCVLGQLYLFLALFRPVITACPVRCHCPMSLTVNCTETGARKLPSEMPSNIHSLFLGSNFISSINDDYFQDLPDLTELHLGRNRISRLPDFVFRPLKSLEFLDLRFNGITRVPAHAFSGLASVVELNLCGNRIESISEDAFAEMRSMERLNLSGSSLRVSGLPQGLFDGARNLKWLDIGGSELTTVPTDVFKQLGNLTFLNLSGNRGINLDMPDLFSSLQKMETLDLEGCELRHLDPWSFAGATNMIDLRLSFNSLQEALPLALFESTSHLRRLLLNNNSLTHLQDRLFDLIGDLEHLEVFNNPWHCGCGLLGLRARWPNQQPAFLQEGLVCQSPEPLLGQDLWSVPLNEIYNSCVSSVIRMSTLTLWGNSDGLQSLDCQAASGAGHIAWFTPSMEYITPQTRVSSSGPHQQIPSHRLLENGTLIVDSIQLGTYLCIVTFSNGSYNVSVEQVDIVSLKSPGPPEVHDQSNVHVLSAFIVLIILGIVISAAWAACRIRRRHRRNRFGLLTKEQSLMMDMRPRAKTNSEIMDYDYDYAYAHPRERIDLKSGESAYAVGRLWEERQLNGKPRVPHIRPISRSMHERGRPKYYNDCVRAVLPRTSHTFSSGESNEYITPSQISAYSLSFRSWRNQVDELTKTAGGPGHPTCNGVSSQDSIRPDSSDNRYLEIM